MENTGFQDDIDIDVMIPESTIHQYANMEHNNEYHYSLINGKISTSKNSSISTLTYQYVNSTNRFYHMMSLSVLYS